jgi:hypothetical protein
MVIEKILKADLIFMSLHIVLPVMAFINVNIVFVFIIYAYICFCLFFIKIFFGIIHFIKNKISKIKCPKNRSYLIPSILASTIILLYNVVKIFNDYQRYGDWKPLKYIILDNEKIFMSLFIIIGFPFWILSFNTFKKYDERIIFDILSIFTPVILTVNYFPVVSLVDYEYSNIFNWLI